MFFFFKQKTAYEMRISDWSSDVCSSDLGDSARWRWWLLPFPLILGALRKPAKISQLSPQKQRRQNSIRTIPTAIQRSPRRRSEEHTSELQSLLRISYAVFCFKKKKEREPMQRHYQN